MLFIVSYLSSDSLLLRGEPDFYNHYPCISYESEQGLMLAKKDYTRNQNGSLLTISGESRVLRALWTIGFEKISFPYQSRYSKLKYEQLRYKYTFAISPTECSVTDSKFVKRADQMLFAAIREKVNTIHGKFLGSSSDIMKVLTQDLADIDKLPQGEETVFHSPKYLLAAAAITVALEKELSQRTVVESYKLFKGDSLLAPLYKAMLDNDDEATSLAPLIKDKKEKLGSLYHEHVRTPVPVVASGYKPTK